MQSTVLAGDERLDSLAPLEWDTMSMLGCAGWNCCLGWKSKGLMLDPTNLGF